MSLFTTMKTVTRGRKLETLSLVEQLTARSCKTKTISVVFIFFGIYAVFLITKSDFPKNIGEKEGHDEMHGRNADDGRWLVQRHPFELFVYSAFYDNRWSLGANDEAKRGQVTVVAVSRNLRAITHCCLFHDNSDGRESCLTVKATSLNYVIICKIPDLKGDTKWGISGHPSTVRLHWGTADNQSTAFRVPVERVMPRNATPRIERPGNIAMCVQRLHGDVIEPNIAVEWLEMMRLLGVEHVVLYNHSVSERLGRAITGYMNLQSPYASFRVELRQSWPVSSSDHQWLSPEKSVQVYEGPCLTDCYYRLAGRYKWIVSHDFDELLTPHTSSHLNLLQMIQAITDNGEVRVGRFAFRLMFFYHDLNLLNRNESWDETFVHGRAVNTSLSYFQTMNLRWNPSPVGYNSKCIHDTDACLEVHVHTCATYTVAFERSSKRRTVVLVDGTRIQLVKSLAVPASTGLIHHHRICCNVDNRHELNEFRPGSCRDQRMYKDNIIATKYGEQLTERLAVTLRKLNLAANRFPKMPAYCPIWH